MSVVNIVLTGGPCAGKSTGLSLIEQELTNRGYKVYIVAESATELILGGIKPVDVSLKEFQKTIFQLQFKKEELYRNYAYEYSLKSGQNCVIIYDRGLMDGKSFMPDDEFLDILKELQLKEVDVRDRYDGVFHLVTAANGAAEYYTLGNNKARSEGIEEAIKVDNACIAAWTGHPHFRVIDNNFKDFSSKLDKLKMEILRLLGEPVSVEIERKYLIKMPKIEELMNKYSVTKVEIIQTYLNSVSNVERRVRQRGSNGAYSYYYTEKRGTGLSRVEVERKVSESEYLKLLMDADTHLRQIRKDRYCFIYNSYYIELDIYPFWKDNAVVEVELLTETDIVELPQELEVVREVTMDDCFKNYSLAVRTDIL